MLVSIITICYNRKATIDNAIQTVLAQDYPHIEYIVIDGNSTDGTQEIIETYSNKITKYISEPDQGMYDALNKGLGLATGDIVGLMHSDDTFYNSTVVSKIVAAFNDFPTTDGVYGNGIYVSNDAEGKRVRNRIGGQYDFAKLKSGWLPLHPTVYLRKSIIDQYGSYNLDFKIASDTEFLLRYLYKHKIKLTYIDDYVVKMRIGGLSTSYQRAFEVLYEDYRIYKFHHIPALRAVFLKKVSALLQYITK